MHLLAEPGALNHLQVQVAQVSWTAQALDSWIGWRSAANMQASLTQDSSQPFLGAVTQKTQPGKQLKLPKLVDQLMVHAA